MKGSASVRVRAVRSQCLVSLESFFGAIGPSDQSCSCSSETRSLPYLPGAQVEEMDGSQAPSPAPCPGVLPPRLERQLNQEVRAPPAPRAPPARARCPSPFPSWSQYNEVDHPMGFRTTQRSSPHAVHTLCYC